MMFNSFSLMRSLRHAGHGFLYAWKFEQNIRIHVVAGLLVVVLGYVCTLTRGEWALLVFAMGLVLLSELCNSAMEALIDVAVPRVSDSIKHIKDMLAAGVLVASITAFVIGLFVFIPHLRSLFGW